MKRYFDSPIVNVYPDQGILVIRSPYDPSFVADLKRLPAADRRFDPTRKVWLVTPDHATEVEDLVRAHYFQTIHIDAPAMASVPEMRVLDVRYIGQAKIVAPVSARPTVGWI